MKRQQGPNLICGINGTTGFPKARKGNGNRRLVVMEMVLKGINVNGSRSFGSKAHLPVKQVSSLLSMGEPIITDKGDRCALATSTSQNFSNLIHKISDLKRLVIAYELIKSKKGNLTKAVDNKTLDGLTLD